MRHLILVSIICFLTSCAQPHEEISSQSIVIPNVEINISDSRIEKTLDGTIFVSGEPFSGYLLTLNPEGYLERRQSYFQGKLEGLSLIYFPNGQIKEQRTYKSGEKHGEHFGYYQNGQISFQYLFVDGFNEGNHREWFENGNLYADMNYKSGKEFGTQKIWREDGKLRANYIVRENGRRYGLQGIKRCTKLDGKTQTIDPYNESNN